MPTRELKPQEKVEIAVNMTNVVTSICAEGVREANPGITDKELISLLRGRFRFGRRPHREE